MKTSSEFTRNLKNKIITEEMLELAIYSTNKRAKNCRDKKQENYDKGRSSRYGRYFDNVEEYKEKEKEYYSKKDFLIKSLLEPECIHKEVITRTEVVKYEDSDEEFYQYKGKEFHSGSYYDKYTQETVEFIKVLKEITEEKYYLFYKTENYSFHIPVEEYEVKNNKLQVVEIENLVTYGKEINDLASTQFVDKIITLIESGVYDFRK